MTKLESFKKFVEKFNPEVIRVDATFPYQHSEEKAYQVTFKGITQYLFFNSEGTLLQQERVK